MTVVHFCAATVSGALVAITARVLIRQMRLVPLWLAIGTATMAALFGTVIADAAGGDRAGLTIGAVALQILCAALGVMVFTIDDRPSAETEARTARRPDVTSSE